MLRTLHDLFDSLLSPAHETPAEAAARLRLATAVLLVEVMREHPGIAAPERGAVLSALQREFALPEPEARALLAQATAASGQAIDFQTYTAVLNERLDEAQKLRVIEAMWQVAYADGALDAYENHVLWRIADLLYLPHGGYIAAKMRARDAAGVGPALPAT
ncbi:MAG: TerB family tellurite resistance protein [Burkholderiales bacterium]|nr:TerB family tellurite resistance protein [Burkholderiales bacterium]